MRNIPIVAGIIRHSTRDAIKAAREAKQHGADALMITPIQYLGGTDADGNYRFYEAISDAVDLPIIIYNVVPQNEIKPEVAFRLLDIQNVIGVKQSCGGVHEFVQMKTLCGERADVRRDGRTDMYDVQLGADGAIWRDAGCSGALREALGPQEAGDSREEIGTGHGSPDLDDIIGAQFPRRLKAIRYRQRGCGEPVAREPRDGRKLAWVAGGRAVSVRSIAEN